MGPQDDGAPGFVHRAFGECNPVWRTGRAVPRLQWPDHVVPVCAEMAEGYREGMMIAMRLANARQWHLSDAFGRFGPEGLSIHDAFEELVQTLERSWKSHFGTVLPLAWRQPLAVTIDAPIHMEAIAGRSLQWPLALALLRARGVQGLAASFGPGPVFATGLLLGSGIIGEVEGVRSKLAGFVREYGHSRPVLLTHRQRASFASGEMTGLQVHEVNCLGDLFTLEAFRPSADRLSAPAHAQDLDNTLMQMELEAARARFDRVQTMAEWLLPAAEPLPAYAFRVRIQRGNMLLHAGMTEKSRADWEAIRGIVASGEEFSASSRAGFAAAVFTYLMDSGAGLLEAARDWFTEEDVHSLLRAAPPESAAVLYGELSQFYRTNGDYQRAIDCAEQALALALKNHISLAGKYNNFVIHALLARERQQAETQKHHWEEIVARLQDSKSRFLPTQDPGMRELHLGFCRHYIAELHRLTRTGYRVKPLERTLGAWDHPYLFELLSCARNAANSPSQRAQTVDLLLEASGTLRNWSDAPIFRLFEAVYQVVGASIEDKEMSAEIHGLEALLARDPDLSGWQSRLAAPIDALRAQKSTAAVDALCDAIPHF